MLRRSRSIASPSIAIRRGRRRSRPARAAALPAAAHRRRSSGAHQDFSEPDGFFRSDNLRLERGHVPGSFPELQRVVKPGGVYIGVGPEQNFTYIAALKPAMAFIPDIRRGNLQMHLMYKALIEQSADRAEFLSRLFSRKRPDGLTAQSTPQELFTAFAAAEPSDALYQAELLRPSLTTLARARLSDRATRTSRGIEYIFSSFYASGPFLPVLVGAGGGPVAVSVVRGIADGDRRRPAWRAAIWRPRTNYRAVRSLEQRNLIVPLVANFAGPKTLRAVGAWVASGRPRDDVLRVERRAVPVPGRHLGRLRRESGGAADRPDEHVHPVVLQHVRQHRGQSRGS